MSGNYYNEIDPFCAEWLKRLMLFGYIAPGEIDTRSIEDVRPDDLKGFTQCHFFAGIGVWSYALRQAGWPDDAAVWTGSCPCQPFSAAGKGGGFADERHLWPAWHYLIEQCRPSVVFGEQVASKDGLAWLDLVHSDLERASYAVGAFDLCAAGVGAPHIRQRLYFVADNNNRGLLRSRLRLQAREGPSNGVQFALAGRSEICGGDGSQRQSSSGMEHADDDGSGRHSSGLSGEKSGAQGCVRRVADSTQHAGAARDVADANSLPRGQRRAQSSRGDSRSDAQQRAGLGSSRDSFWSGAEWLPCIDGKARPVEPGTFPLAHGAPARVGRLRAYGNAIVAPLAEEFIRAYMTC